MSCVVSLSEAKTQLSALAERAAASEEMVIAEHGAPKARLVPVAAHGARREPANALGMTYSADDFDATDRAVEALFNGDV